MKNEIIDLEEKRNYNLFVKLTYFTKEKSECKFQIKIFRAAPPPSPRPITDIRILETFLHPNILYNQ